MKKLKLPEIKNKGNAILYGCILAGIILRFLMLGSHPLTAQEASAAHFSAGANPVELLLNNLANNNEAPLYYLLTYIWTLIFGFNEVSVRLLPAILGVISIFIVHKLTRSFYSEKVSVIATALFAISPFQIFFSRLSGPFTLQLIAMLLMAYYFMLSVKYNSFVMGPFLFWAITALYCGYLSIVLLMILNVILFIRYKEEIRINLWIRAQIFIFIAWLPLLPYFIKMNTVITPQAINQVLMAPLTTFKNLLFGFTLEMNFWTIAVAAAASLFLIIGVITCRTVKEKRMTDIMSLIFFFTIAFAWASAMANRLAYSDSNFLLAGTMLIILVSIGLSHLSKEGMVLFTLVTVVFFSMSIVNYFNKNLWKTPDYKALYLEVVDSYREGDIIIHTSAASYGPFEFYNKLEYKRNFPNRLIGVVPEFSGSARVRDSWRKVKKFLLEKAGMDIYAGYDKNLMTWDDFKAKAASSAKVYFVPDKKGGNQGKNNSEIFSGHLDAAKVKWAGGYFRIVKTSNIAGSVMYTLEKK